MSIPKDADLTIDNGSRSKERSGSYARPCLFTFIPAPAIDHGASTYSLNTRRHRPFVRLNRHDLDVAAHTRGCDTCGYKGIANLFFPRDGSRSPTTFVYSSRRRFLSALERSEVICENCLVERRGFRKGGKPRCITVGTTLTRTLEALTSERIRSIPTETVGVSGTSCPPTPPPSEHTSHPQSAEREVDCIHPEDTNH